MPESPKGSGAQIPVLWFEATKLKAQKAQANTEVPPVFQGNLLSPGQFSSHYFSLLFMSKF